MVTCPECDIEIKIDETDLEEMEVGDPWVCDGCASNLRLASLDPLEFESDDEEEEDEDDEEEEKADAVEGDDDVVDDDDDDADADDWDE
jgi:lysine biosynthesis protein LysW